MDILCFGEVMLRLTPSGHLRLRQSLPGGLNATFGGSEANVAVSLAMFRNNVRYVSALPDNALADALLAQLRGFGIDTKFCVTKQHSRLGIYFLETGANQRSSVVIYDREPSAVSTTTKDEYAFSSALQGVDWIHVSGITPALSERAFQATLELVSLARREGAQVSCDLNFRNKLWKWNSGREARALAQQCMTDVLGHVTVLVANEEDAKDVLGIEAEGTSVEHGRINAQAYVDVARQITERFPHIHTVAITLRESYSATHNNWGGMLWDARREQAFFAPEDTDGHYRPYEIRSIVDRVGGGDAFAAGLIHACGSDRFSEPRDAVRFAAAASCLNHSIPGDFNVVTEREVEALMGGSVSGRVRR